MACERQTAATDHLANSVADVVKKTCLLGGSDCFCDNETSIMAVAEKVKAKVPDGVVVEKYTTTQLSEQRPRRTSSSNNWRSAEHFPI